MRSLDNSEGGEVMFLLGSKRIVSQSYATHKYAEDYAGLHLSNIKIYGRAKVNKVINKYKPHEDTVNYNEYLNNRNSWKDGVYYNLISITGKKVRYHQSELGGNQVELECYEGNKKRIFRILHMADVFVNVGDIIDSSTVIGTQGNTGLVLSNRPRTNKTYGSHVHFEVRDENYNSINPRDYALFNIKVYYKEQTNEIDSTKKQIKIIVDKINIRQAPDINSNVIGGVYSGEIYTVHEEKSNERYNWYKIETGLDIVGFIANEKNKNWVEVYEPNSSIEGEHKPVDELKEPELIFTCKKDAMYAIKLKEREKLYLE